LRPPLGERAELPDLLALVDAELINVVAYIARRCGDRSLAEDLAADVILRAVLETKRTGIVVTPAWLTTVARNRLVDHWRSSAREERRLRMAWSDPDPDEWLDDGAPLDSHVVNEAMRAIPPMYQAVLSLRYLDDLSVPVVAHELGRSVHSTESLLVRARRAFRASYLEHDGD
jgi:RNA polymerase sigma-70 factor (ECF subfamily)